MDETDAGRRLSIAPLPPIGRRRAVVDLHSHLRALIIEGVLPPGAELNQAELARALGVSRIPLREAFRMLQQEGLITADPDRRPRVVALDVASQDALWASRILHESLAVRMTVGSLGAPEMQRLEQIIETMARTIRDASPEVWRTCHREFHELSGSRGGPMLNKLISELADKTSQYLAVRGRPSPISYEVSLRDHRDICEAFVAGNSEEVVRATAAHLGRPALIHMAEIAPEYEPLAVRTALAVLGVKVEELNGACEGSS